MPRTGLSLEFTGKDQGYAAMLKRAEQLVGRLEEKNDRLTESTRKASDEERKYGRMAERVLRQIATPQEQYNRKVGELSELLKRGKLNQEQYGRAVDIAKRRMDEAGKAGKKTFGTEAAGQLARYAAGVASIATAVNTVKMGFQAADAARQQLAADIPTVAGSMGKLGQVARNPQDFQRMIGEADALYRWGGAENRASAMQLRYQVRSVGQDEYLPLFGKLRKRRLISDPAATAEAAATLTSNMGQAETGDLRAILSKAFGATEFATGTTEGLIQSIAKSSSLAKTLGISDEELFAVGAVLSRAGAGTSEGGTMLENLLTSLEESGPSTSGNLMQRLRQVEAGGGIRGQAFGEFFGRKESRRAFRAILEDPAMYEKALAGVETAQEENALQWRLKLGEQRPEIRLADLQDRQRANAELAGQRMGQAEALYQAEENAYLQYHRARGTPEWATQTMMLMGRFQKLYRGPEGQLRELREHGGLKSAEAARELDRLGGAAENLNQAASRMHGDTLGRPGEDR